MTAVAVLHSALPPMLLEALEPENQKDFGAIVLVEGQPLSLQVPDR